ncbi:MAG: MarR family transcriptional regulator [Candidatus Nitrosocaldus sp.]
MGGAGKKPVGAEAKRQLKEQEQQEARKEKGKKEKGEERQRGAVLVDEKQLLNTLSSMKAITAHAVSRSIGVKVSVANAMLKRLETQGMVRRFGGYSGHYVYQLVDNRAK